MTQRLYILILTLAATWFVRAQETNVVSNAATNVVSAATNAPVETAAAKVSSDEAANFDEFKIITQRNIFDPNRRVRGSRPSNEDRPKPTRVDYLNLVGAMSYEKGRFAFFDGSSSEYRKSVKPGDSIAGYKIADVTASKVTLESGEKKVELPVGGQMKRVDEGEWQVNHTPDSFASSSGSSSSSSTSSGTNSGPSGASSGSSDEENPILKRLLEQRRQGK
jgi:hypothetical protein